jgi:hypothetical protein
MPVKTGTVECVRVSESAAFTRIQGTDGVDETFILWYAPGTQIPRTLTSFTRIVHSMWLSMLREAQANSLTVQVFHPTNSAEVTALQLGI